MSAIADGVEVTITNKPKDRESPAKGRKQRDQATPREREHKDSVKEVPTKDVASCEKPISCSKDENKQKDAVVLSIGPSKDTPAAFSQRGDDKKNIKKDKADVKPSAPSSIPLSEDSTPDSGPAVITTPSSIPENAPGNGEFFFIF